MSNKYNCNQYGLCLSEIELVESGSKLISCHESCSDISWFTPSARKFLTHDIRFLPSWLNGIGEAYVAWFVTLSLI